MEAGVAAERSRAQCVKILLLVGIVVDATAILSGMAQYAPIERATGGLDISEAEAAANDARHGMIEIFQLLVFLATSVFGLVWVYRAYSNLTLMGTKKSDCTLWWAVGWWFVPVMSLTRPYQITKEVWLRSARWNALDSVKEFAAPGLLPAWWAVYIISFYLDWGWRSWASRVESIDQIQGVTLMGVFLNVAAIISAVLAFTVVGRIDSLQREALLASGGVVQQPPPAT